MNRDIVKITITDVIISQTLAIIWLFDITASATNTIVHKVCTIAKVFKAIDWMKASLFISFSELGINLMMDCSICTVLLVISERNKKEIDKDTDLTEYKYHKGIIPYTPRKSADVDQVRRKNNERTTIDLPA